MILEGYYYDSDGAFRPIHNDLGTIDNISEAALAEIETWPSCSWES